MHILYQHVSKRLKGVKYINTIFECKTLIAYHFYYVVT